jgi:hypothetical protein
MAVRYNNIKSLKHDQPLAAALGDMVVAWAYAEAILIGTLTRILGSDLNTIQSGYYRIPTFESRVKFIRALMTHWKPPQGFKKDAIGREIDKLGKIAGTRNHWIHGDWCVNPNTAETVVFDHRSDASSPNRRKPVKAADVKNHCEAVIHRADTIYGLINFDSLPP